MMIENLNMSEDSIEYESQVNTIDLNVNLIVPIDLINQNVSRLINIFFLIIFKYLLIPNLQGNSIEITECAVEKKI